MIEDQLAGFVANLSYRSIDDTTLRILKRNILDSYAGICASLRDTEILWKFDAMVSFGPDENGMSVWGVDKKAPVPDALFMNTILARRSDLLNTYFSPGAMGANHPPDNVALVLCMADRLSANGRDFLRYTYAAFLLSCAFSDYYNPEAAGYDHDAAAILYTSLILGYMLDLDVDQLVEVQRIAGVSGLDINQTATGEVTDWKHCTYASCALRAIYIVRMVRAGFTGARNIYDGKAGVSRFFPHAAEILGTLPDLGSVVFKRWPALVFCQTPIDVAVEISDRTSDPESIVRVDVLTYERAIRNASTESAWHPVSRAGRTHSIPYCVAVALLKRTVDDSFFDDDFALRETGIRSLMEKIRVEEDPGMTAASPDAAPCRIKVTFRDGTTIDHRRDYPKGDPHDPLSDADLEAKARTHLTRMTDDATAGEIIRRIGNLEKEETIHWLVDPLKKNLLNGRNHEL